MSQVLQGKKLILWRYQFPFAFLSFLIPEILLKITAMKIEIKHCEFGQTLYLFFTNSNYLHSKNYYEQVVNINEFFDLLSFNEKNCL
jgi:hypothetical protein